MTMGDRTQQSATLLTAGGSWFISQGRAFPQSAEGRAAAEEQYGRQLLPILRARHDPSFRAAPLAPATIEGTPVNRVRVQHHGVDVTLNLDAATAQIHSLSFVGRNMDAEVGDYTILLSDYRDVSGVRLPFSERALFNGAPDAFMTRTIQAITLNAPLDAASFQPGGEGGR
jgi:hypothetical protein